MKLKKILERADRSSLTGRLPSMLEALPTGEAFDIHELARRFQPTALTTIRTCLSHIKDKERYMVRVGREFYYGNPVAIATLKEEHYGKDS